MNLTSRNISSTRFISDNNVALQVADEPDVYTLAFMTIDSLIRITNDLGMATFEKLQRQGNTATDAKSKANIMQAKIDQLMSSGTSATGIIPDEVVTWMQANDVPVYAPDHTTDIANFMSDNYVNKDNDWRNRQFKVASMTIIKNSIDTYAQKSLDSVNTVNLQIQQITQKMSYLISLLSNMLSARYDQSKGVVQNIR